MGFVLTAFVAFLVSLVGTELVRRNAGRLRLIQDPNERSSHHTPTPSGGGVAIAVGGTLAGLTLGFCGALYLLIPVAIGSVAALLGLLDDRYQLSARFRLAIQCILVAVLLAAVGQLPAIPTPFGALPQIVAYGILILAGIWWINLFNFMDGIDGIAATEAMFVLVGAMALMSEPSFFAPERGPALWWAVAVVASCAGFLIHNWPPAKIFMGDAGSNYLAVIVLAIALTTIVNHWLGYEEWAILVASFAVDSTVTLVRRLWARQRWFLAHRLHAYQKLSRKWQTHGRVTLLYIAINVVWLYPLAYLAHARSDLAGWAVVVAYLPLIAFCILTGAGKPDVAAT